VRLPSVGGCFLALTLTRLSLKFAGFRRTTRWARGLARRTVVGAVDRDGSERAARRVAVAAAFFPGRAICLEQSIALYVILRRRAVPAVLRIGVQPYPFKAHAWVEVGGQPVYENADELVRFVAFPEESGAAA
jgi:Transglutaminase-like superfamily